MWNERDGIWIIDADSSTLYANSAMAEILGVEPAALIGRSSFLFVFREDLRTAQELFRSHQTGQALPFQFRLQRYDGSSVWVDVQGTPMHNVAGEFLGVVGRFRLAEERSEREWAA